MKSLRKCLLILCSILLLAGCKQDIRFAESVSLDDFLFSYFSTRYSNVDTDNFWERRESLQDFYSDGYQNKNDWDAEVDNLQETFSTMQNQSICTKLLEIRIIETVGDTYTLSVHVLFDAEEDELSHYRDYIFDVVVVEENHQIKIDDITTVQNIATAFEKEPAFEHTH